MSLQYIANTSAPASIAASSVMTGCSTKMEMKLRLSCSRSLGRAIHNPPALELIVVLGQHTLLAELVGQHGAGAADRG